VFSLCCGYGSGGILRSERGRRRASALCSGNFCVRLAVGQHEEAEVVAQKRVAFADPAIVVRTGRIGEPVAGEGEVLSQGRQRSVAGIVIAVEADRIVGDGGERGAGGLRRRRLGAGSGCEDEESEEGCELSHKKIENRSEPKF